MTIVVTVGRNVGDSLDARPMGNASWLNLQLAVDIAVRHYGEVYFAGVGEGYSEQWGREDAFTIVAEGPQYSDHREALLAELARIGRFYGQEAVAVTEGATVFV